MGKLLAGKRRGLEQRFGSSLFIKMNKKKKQTKKESLDITVTIYHVCAEWMGDLSQMPTCDLSPFPKTCRDPMVLFFYEYK